AQRRAGHGDDVGRLGDRLRGVTDPPPAAQLERGDQHGRLGRADPGDAGQLGRVGPGERGQRAESGQQPLGDGVRTRPWRAGAEQDGEQLAVGQGGAAEDGQALPGPLPRRQVGDQHAGTVAAGSDTRPRPDRTRGHPGACPAAGGPVATGERVAMVPAETPVDQAGWAACPVSPCPKREPGRRCSRSTPTSWTWTSPGRPARSTPSAPPPRCGSAPPDRAPPRSWSCAPPPCALPGSTGPGWTRPPWPAAGYRSPIWRPRTSWWSRPTTGTRAPVKACTGSSTRPTGRSTSTPSRPSPRRRPSWPASTSQTSRLR